MSMICDNSHFYNKTCNHDAITSSCAIWADFYNFMATLPWLSEAEVEQFLQEKSEYLCYDV